MDQETLDALSDSAETSGVSLAVELEISFPHIWIESIERTATGTKGAGGAVLRRLFGMADEAGLPVRAAVWAENEGLLAWYTALGFAIEHMPTDLEGHDDHCVIARYPNGATDSARRPQHQES